MTISFTFRAFHPSLQCERISEDLGLQPYLVQDAGKPRKDIKGRTLPGSYRTTLCSYRVEVGSYDEFLSAAGQLLDHLDASAERWREFLTTGGSFSFFVSVHASRNCPFPIEPAFLTRMGSWNVRLDLDFYGYDASADNAAERPERPR